MRRVLWIVCLVGLPFMIPPPEVPRSRAEVLQEKLIEKRKFQDSVHALKKIGWFSPVVIDHILMEAS